MLARSLPLRLSSSLFSNANRYTHLFLSLFVPHNHQCDREIERERERERDEMRDSAALFHLLFLSLLFHSHSALHPDVPPLMGFKSASGSPAALSSWDPAVDPCSGRWLGVSCARAGWGRVTRVVLEGLGLAGPLAPLTGLSRLELLSLKNNSLSAPLHLLEVSSWRPHLKILRLSSNSFSGSFPASLLLLRHLRRLDLADNLLSGAIPSEIGALLPRLITLRLESNHIAGEIPMSLASVPALFDLNLSHNRLTGEIPPSLSVFPLSSFAGNQNLCGKPVPKTCTNFTAPINPPTNREGKWSKVAILIAITASAAAAATVLVATAALFLHKRRRRKGNKGNGSEVREVVEGKRELERMVVFEGTKGFEVEELMRGSAEMLGRGAAGTTYRVVMEERGGVGVAVKRVRRERSGRRRAEEERLMLREMGGWRHPNVVSLRGYHFSEDELLLVSDYLSGGSLHSLLHGYRGPGRTPLDWRTRLRLASGAANGLAFLHNMSESKLSHQHLTSENILIDAEGNACISDFAILQLQYPSSPSSSSRMVSSKNVTRESSQTSDVYSFGVILLELLTGRTTGDGCMDLSRWVQRVVREEWTSEVFDFELLRYKEIEGEMVALLQVALLCLAPEPKDRPRMSVVYMMIEDIRERGSRTVRVSPSPSTNDHSYQSSSPCISEENPCFH